MLWQVTAQVNSEPVNQRLFQAAEHGDMTTVRHQLLSGANPNITNESGETLFNKVLEANPNAALVKLFLDKGAKPDEKDGMGFTPLRKAVMFSDKPEVIRLILEKKVDPNVLDTVVTAGNEEFVKLLLDAEADVNRRYADGMTALHLAVEAGNESVVSLLLEHLADPNLKDGQGRVPLFIANVGSEQAIADLLLQHGADPKLADIGTLKQKLTKVEQDENQQPKSQVTPILQLLRAIHDDDEKKVKTLLDNGVSPNAIENGGTPLIYAIAEGRNRIVSVLLEYNKENHADPNMARANGSVPLEYAVQDNNVEAGKLLLKAGAKPQIPGMKSPPLMNCIGDGYTDFALLLMENGADPEFKDAKGYSCVAVPTTEKNAEIMGIARRHIFDRYWIHDPAEFKVVDERIRQINGGYDKLGFIEKADVALQAMVTYDPEREGSRTPEKKSGKKKGKKKPETTALPDFGKMKFVDNEGHELKYMRGRRSDKSNPFAYKEGGAYFNTPREVLAPPREADCDEVAGTYANYLNIVLGIPLENMWMMDIHGEQKFFKEDAGKFDHGALVFKYNGTYYLADPVNDVFEKLSSATPEGLKSELIAIYEKVVKERSWFAKTLEIDRTDPEKFELTKMENAILSGVIGRKKADESKK